MITLNDYLTSSGKFKDRAKSKEVTTELLANVNKLLTAVNGILQELGVTLITVTSGFRPSNINAKVGGAKKSLHMTGLAIDLFDPDNQIGKQLKERYELLDKYELWLEEPSKTPQWLHLDMSKNRPNREKRIFLP
jgi:hypothetical protein